jgi:hypothetical protein
MKVLLDLIVLMSMLTCGFATSSRLRMCHRLASGVPESEIHLGTLGRPGLARSLHPLTSDMFLFMDAANVRQTLSCLQSAATRLGSQTFSCKIRAQIEVNPSLEIARFGVVVTRNI